LQLNASSAIGREMQRLDAVRAEFHLTNNNVPDVIHELNADQAGIIGATKRQK